MTWDVGSFGDAGHVALALNIPRPYTLDLHPYGSFRKSVLGALIMRILLFGVLY